MQHLVDQAKQVMEFRERLGAMSYYEILGLALRADYVMVREAFYGRAQGFHPDRFVVLDDETVKKAAYEVYKRMTEAYNVLSDPELRRRYDQALARGEVRLAPEHRGRRLDADERRVSNALARVYYRAARQKLASGDDLGAGIDAELGLSLEESEPLLAVRDESIRRLARPGETP